MPASGFLQTLAEISIAFAGFASIVVMFRRRDPASWGEADALRYQTMLTGSLAALFFSVVPITIHFCGASDPVVWRISSVSLAAWLLFNFLSNRQTSNRLSRETSISSSIARVFRALSGVAFLLQLTNLHLALPGPFIVGVVYVLSTAGLTFFRLVQIEPPAV